MRAKQPADPYSLAVKWLAVRELTEVQVRERLRARQVSSQIIEDVVARLRRGGALDDRRTALACARTHALVKRQGRNRVLRELEASGIDRDLARQAVQDVFDHIDERDLMERALARRLGRGRRTIRDAAEYRRVYGYLVRQGFEASAVSALLRERSRGPAQSEDE